MREIDQFEDFFRDQFEDFESEPKAEEWTQIQARLNKKRRRGLVLWWIPASIAAMLAAFLLFNMNRTTDSNTIKNSDSTTVNDNNSENKNTPNSLNKNNSTSDTTPIIQEKNDVLRAFDKNEVNVNTKSNKKIDLNTSEKHYEITHIKNETTVYHEVPNIENSKPASSEEAPKQEFSSKEPNTIQNQLHQKLNVLLAALPTLSMKELVFSSKEPRVDFNVANSAIKKPLKKSNSVITYGLNIAPTYNFKNVKSNTTDATFVQNIQNPSLASSKRVGLQVESDVNVKLNRFLGISGILNYQYTPFDVAYELRDENTVTVTSAFVNNNAQSFNINDVSYQYNSIPLHQNWHAINAALAFDFYLNEKNKLSAGFGIGKWLGKDKPAGTPLFATGSFTHQFKKGLQLIPFVRYDVKSYTVNNELMSVQPYQIGMKIQMSR